MFEAYQHFPEHINPIIFQIGFFSIKWYSIMYLVAFAVVYGLLMYRKKEILLGENQKSKCKNQNGNAKFKNYFLKIDTLNLLLYLIIGLLIGARLGYVIFYNFDYYYHNLSEIFLPIQITNYELRITGLYGMSYFGGLIGIIFSGLFFCRKYKINFWQLADFAVPAVPAGYFFGRIGNFLNGELYGRATNKFWGMYFPTDPENLLRHPSQLYEAFFEGVVLFAVLWALRNKNTGWWSVVSDKLLIIYLFGYGFFRFFIEFFREPDPQIRLFFGCLSLGQVFSAIAIITAVFIMLIRKKPDISQCAKNGL